MARYDFRSNGSASIAVADGDFFTEKMGLDFDRCEFFIRFYSDEALTTPVTPTAGSIEFTATHDSEDSGQRWMHVQRGQFYAVLTDDIDLKAPYANGSIARAKVTLTGIAGANYFKAWVVRN